MFVLDDQQLHLASGLRLLQNLQFDFDQQISGAILSGYLSQTSLQIQNPLFVYFLDVAFDNYNKQNNTVKI